MSNGIEQARNHLMKKVGNAAWTEEALCGGLRPHGWDSYRLAIVMQTLINEGRLVKGPDGLIRLP